MYRHLSPIAPSFGSVALLHKRTLLISVCYYEFTLWINMLFMQYLGCKTRQYIWYPCDPRLAPLAQRSPVPTKEGSSSHSICVVVVSIQNHSSSPCPSIAFWWPQTSRFAILCMLTLVRLAISGLRLLRLFMHRLVRFAVSDGLRQRHLVRLSRRIDRYRHRQRDSDRVT